GIRGARRLARWNGRNAVARIRARSAGMGAARRVDRRRRRAARLAAHAARRGRPRCVRRVRSDLLTTPARVTWLGHSTVMVELQGTTILTDPLLRGRVMHLRRIAPATPPREIDVDAVL